jgi:hypothetical protein
VLYRVSYGGSTYWRVGSSDALNDCNNYGIYLRSASNPGRPGGAPTAPVYSAGSGWYDDNGARDTITVTAGDGSAIGGGGGGH